MTKHSYRIAGACLLAGAFLISGWQWARYKQRDTAPKVMDAAAVVAKPAAPAVLPLVKPARRIVEQPAGVVKVPPVAPEAPEPISAFREWASEYYNAEPADRPAMMERGKELAQAHRKALKAVITSNPQLAIEMAVPMVVRQDLPDEIEAELEERVNARGQMLALGAVPLEGPDAKPEGFRPMSRKFFPEGAPAGDSYNANVYGDRAQLRTVNKMRVNGVAVDGELAVLDSALRILEVGERPDSSKGVVEYCPVSGETTEVKPMEARAKVAAVADSGVVAEDYSRVMVFCRCRSDNVADNARQLLEEEIGAHWGDLLADGASAGGIKPFDVPGGWTTGTKSLLYLRAAFPDNMQDPQNEASVYDNLRQATDYFMNNSFGRYYLTPTVAPLVVLPYAESWYLASRDGANQPNGEFVLRAHALEIARRMGYDTDNYDLDAIEYKGGPGSFGGLGSVGGKAVWLKTSNLGVLIHELGHNLGLPHSNWWWTNPPSKLGAGGNWEYGNKFDVMGSSGAIGHFVAAHKRTLGWLTPDAVHTVSANGSYRIYQIDQGRADADKRYAMSVVKDSERNYWLEFRQGFPDNPILNSGALVTWGRWGSGSRSETVFGSAGGAQLLDMTPGSGHLNDTRDDAGLPLGRTYSDPEVDLHITPVFKSKTNPPYLDVVVNRGPFPGNRPPNLSLSASALTISANGSITFTAAASDPDGDTVAYYWDFGDGSVSVNNARIQTKSWTAGGEYRVLCTASDMKGGRNTKGLLVRVNGGPENQFKVSGTITDDNGDPVEGVYVTNRPLVGDTFAQPNPATFRYTYTDSNGNYTLTRLPAGATSISASLHPWSLTPIQPSDFNLSEDLTGRNWDVLGLVESVNVEVTVSQAVEGGPGAQIKLTRADPAGYLAVQVMMGSRGTAIPGTDYTMNPVPVVPNPNNRVELRGTVGYLFIPGQSTLTIDINANDDGLPEGTEYAIIEFPDTAYHTNTDDGPRVVPFHVSGERTVVIPIIDANSSLPVVTLTAESPNLSENGDKGIFTISRDGPTTLPLTVNLDYSGQAVEGTDFTGPASVEIPAGTSSVAVELTPIDDLDAEGTENFTVALVGSPGYAIDTKRNAADFYLADNDQPLLTVRASVPTATEAGRNAGKFTITRAAADIGNNLLVYFSLGGSALSGTDYQRVDGSALIPANELSVDVPIIPFDDNIDEPNQTVILRLATHETYAIAPPGQATVTIIDNDSSQFSIQSSMASVTEPGANPITRDLFTVYRPATGTAATVNYRVAPASTATSGADFEALTGQLVFAAGDTSLPIPVTILPDNLQENAETIVIELLPGAGYRLGFEVSSTAYILDDDQPLIDVSFADQSALANISEGIGNIRFYFARTGSTANPRTVNYTLGGTALLGSDYTIATNATQTPTQVTMNAGQRGVYLTINITDDVEIEGTESLTVSAAPSASYGIRFGSSTVFINDNDAYAGAPPPAVGFTLANSSVNERTGNSGSTHQVEVSLNEPQAQQVVVEYRVNGGSATGQGVDYEMSSPGILTFLPGETVKSLNLNTVKDDFPEGDETVILRLYNNVGANLATSTHIVTITDQAFPEVLTDPIAAAAHLTADLRGRAMPGNRNTTAWFEWGASATNLKNKTTDLAAGAGTTFFNMADTITGLTYPGTYFYRAVAQNNLGTSRGIIRTIRTIAPPTVITENDAGHTSSSVILAGTINPNRGFCDVWFEWGETPALGNVTAKQPVTNATKELGITSPLTGLAEGTLVYYRMVAESRAGLGIINGDVKFSSAIPHRIAGDLLVHVHAKDPTAGTAAWTNLGFIGGDFTRAGTPTTVTDVFGTGVPGVLLNGIDSTYELAGPPPDMIGNSNRSIEIWSLNPGYATPDSLANLGRDGANTQVLVSHNNLTHPDGALRHGTSAAGNAAYTAANLPPLARWNHFVYVFDGKKTATLYVNGKKVAGKNTGALSTTADPITVGAARDNAGLPHRFYHGYINSLRVHGGALAAKDVQANFAIGPIRFDPAAPIAVTTGISDLTSTSSILNGLVTPNGADTTAWIEWGSTADYDNASPPVNIGSGQVPVPVTLSLATLVPGLEYHYRVVASSSEGVTEGEDVVFVPQPLSGKGSLWVDLRAHEFMGGASWKNSGGLGDFDAVGAPVVVPDVLSTGYPGVQFDGASTAFVSSSSAPPDISHADDRTIEVWALNPSLDQPVETFFHQGRPVLPSSQLRLGHGSTGGVDDNGTADTWASATPPGEPPVGQWNHFALVISGNTRTLFVNGQQKATSTHSAGFNHLDDALLIGAVRDAGGAVDFTADAFSGFLNTIRVHGGVLTPAQILTNFQIGPAKSGAAPGLAPVVNTLSATVVSSAHATLQGTVLGGALPTTYWFEWGDTPALGQSTPPTSLLNSFVTQTVDGLIGGLNNGQAVHYRVVAENDQGIQQGAILDFVATGAPAGLPGAVTNPATAITANKATFNGTATPNGAASQAWFEYGSTPALGTISPKVSISAAAANKVMTFAAKGLLSHTTYFFRLIVENANGLVAGAIQSFPTGNGLPVALAGSLKNVKENATVLLPLKGTDPDKEPLVFAISSPPDNGVIGGASPNFTYTSTGNFSGVDTLQFTVTDGAAVSAPATFTITVVPVNDPPIAVSDVFNGTEDIAINGNLSGTDEEGDPITAYTLVTPPLNGVVNLNTATGAFTYTPAPDFFGADFFRFTVTAGGQTSAPGQIDLNLAPVPDVPIALATGVWTDEDQDIDAQALANDPDGDSLTYTKMSDPSDGNVTVFNTDGSFTYSPDPGFVGTDTFTFKANDGSNDSNVATVTITVGGPSATGMEVSGFEDDLISGQLEAIDPNLASLTFSLVSGPQNGVVTVNPDGAFFYNPPAGFLGVDSFVFKAGNGVLDSNPATVTITVVKRPPDWIWAQGPNTPNKLGAYGQQGVPAAANHPGARTDSASWTALNGDLYLFGGNGFGESGKAGLLNDLWKRDALTGEWTWISGSKIPNAVGLYGAQNVTNAADHPGARAAAACWSAPDGRFWLFGGNGFDRVGGKAGLLNDLWVFDPGTGIWTWIKGSNLAEVNGTYNTKGVPSTTGTPGSRQGAAAWVDATGNLWLYGGQGRAGTGTAKGFLSDLWKFDSTANRWAWVHGGSGLEADGIYGPLGVASSLAAPGARAYASAWYGQDGLLWLFGGQGRAAAPGKTAGFLNDLWTFDPESNTWTWRHGATAINAVQTLGLLGLPAPANTPGARAGAMTWTRGGDQLYIFGGQGRTGATHDLWVFSKDSTQWTCLKTFSRTNAPGVYGTLGLGAPGNTPGARRGGVAALDLNGNVLLIGGASGKANFSDLWRLDLPAVPRIQTLAADLITDTDADLHASVQMGELPGSAFFQVYPLGRIQDGFETAPFLLDAGGPQPVDDTVSGLEPGTTYVARAIADNGFGRGYGAPVTFDTTGAPAPVEVEFLASSDSVGEADGFYHVQVILSSPAPAPFTVPFSIAGSAEAGQDYTAPASEVLIFTPGQSSTWISLPIANDTLNEQPETIILTLGAPSAVAALGVEDTFTLTIDDDDDSPVVTTEPVSQFVAVGDDVTLFIDADGSRLRYQWRLNGKDITGATAASYVFKASLASAGLYTCFVSNELSDTTSDAAEIFVVDATPQTVLKNSGNHTFTVKAAGPPGETLIFRWRNGVANPLLDQPGHRTGTQTPSLVITGLIPTDSETYICNVSKSGVPAFNLDSGPHLLAVPDAAPLITSISLPQGVVGVPYSHQVTVNPDPRKRPAKYTATGLVKGLKINGTTGVITGEPLVATPGTNVTIRATNTAGFAEVILPLEVIDLPANTLGTFVGLIERADATGGKGGRLDVTTATNGDYTLKLTLSGFSGSAKGPLVPTLAGNVVTHVGATTLLKRNGLPDLSVAFEVEAASGALTIALDDPNALPTLANGTGLRQTWSSGPAAPNPGDYTMLLDLPVDKVGALDIPQGNPYAAFKLTDKGVISGAGRSSDGLSFTFATILGPNREIQLFIPFSPVLGSLHGITTADLDGYLSGPVTWSKDPAPAKVKNPPYPLGFDVVTLSSLGGPYAPVPNGGVIMGLPNAPDKARLSFFEGGLLPGDIDPLVFSITNPNPAKNAQLIGLPNPNAQKLSFTLPKSPVGGFAGKITILNPISSLNRNLSYQGIMVKFDATTWRAAGYTLIQQLPQPGQTLNTAPTLSAQVTLDEAP